MDDAGVVEHTDRRVDDRPERPEIDKAGTAAVRRCHRRDQHRDEHERQLELDEDHEVGACGDDAGHAVLEQEVRLRDQCPLRELETGREDHRQQTGEEAADPGDEQPARDRDGPLVGDDMREDRGERDDHERVADGAPADANAVPRDHQHERGDGEERDLLGAGPEQHRRGDDEAESGTDAHGDRMPDAGERKATESCGEQHDENKHTPAHARPRVLAHPRSRGTSKERTSRGGAASLPTMRVRQGTKIRTRRRLAGLPAALRPVWPHAKRAYATTIRAVAPATQWLSRARGGYGPRRIARSADAVVERGEGTVWVMRDAETLTRVLPPGVPHAHPTFRGECVERVPRLVVAALPGGRSFGAYRAILTASGTFVDELSPYFGTTRPDHHPAFLAPLPPPPVHVAGRVGVLAARGDVAYYHFLVDVLPRLALLEACPPEVAPERLYVPSSLPFAAGAARAARDRRRDDRRQ